MVNSSEWVIFSKTNHLPTMTSDKPRPGYVAVPARYVGFSSNIDQAMKHAVVHPYPYGVVRLAAEHPEYGRTGDGTFKVRSATRQELRDLYAHYPGSPNVSVKETLLSDPFVAMMQMTHPIVVEPISLADRAKVVYHRVKTWAEKLHSRPTARPTI